MIIIGNTADISDTVPLEILDDVTRIATMLDECYGERNIYTDDGGLIVICESIEDLNHAILRFPVLERDIPENISTVGSYERSDYLLNNEYCISVYYTKQY